jgi:hypothetical protein
MPHTPGLPRPADSDLYNATIDADLAADERPCDLDAQAAAIEAASVYFHAERRR